MAKILNVQQVKQKHENSCWAACIRMVLSYDGLIITNDDTLAAKCGVQPNQCQDAAAMMTKCNIFDSTDDEALVPTLQEIKAEIDKGRPIIQCVNETEVLPGGSSVGGHYILIVGYDTDKKQLVIIDPADGQLHYCDYSAKTIHLKAYGKALYYAQPYYTQKGKPF